MDSDATPLRLQIGHAVRYYRERVGMSVETLADTSGIGDPNRLQSIESGTLDGLLVEDLVQLAAALKVPLYTLIRGPSPRTGQDEGGSAKTSVEDRIVMDTINLLQTLKAQGRLSLSEDLIEPYAQAVAERAMSGRDEPEDD